MLILVAMPKLLQHPLAFLVVATALETAGDAIVRRGLYQHEGLARGGIYFIGAICLFGYGLFLNLAPLDFGRVVGLYIATLFIMFQLVNFIAFRAIPTLPIFAGGILIVAGGAIVSFWKP